MVVWVATEDIAGPPLLVQTVSALSGFSTHLQLRELRERKEGLALGKQAGLFRCYQEQKLFS